MSVFPINTYIEDNALLEEWVRNGKYEAKQNEPDRDKREGLSNRWSWEKEEHTDQHTLHVSKQIHPKTVSDEKQAGGQLKEAEGGTSERRRQEGTGGGFERGRWGDSGSVAQYHLVLKWGLF